MTTPADDHLSESGTDAQWKAMALRIQELEDLLQELTEIALVNRAATLAAMSKNLISREELRAVYERIETAHGQAQASGSDSEYRILPAAAAYFLETD